MSFPLAPQARGKRSWTKAEIDALEARIYQHRRAYYAPEFRDFRARKGAPLRPVNQKRYDRRKKVA